MLGHSNSYLAAHVLFHDNEFTRKILLSYLQIFFLNPHSISAQSMYVCMDAALPVYSLFEFSWQFD